MSDPLYPGILDLFITKDCNLNCAYCYVYKGDGAKKLTSPKTYQNRIIDIFLNVPGTWKTINFTGGEPCCAFEKVKKACGYAKNGPSSPRSINFNMTTNATLLSQQKIDFLKKNNFDLQISIDGTQPSHDLHRPYRRKKKALPMPLSFLPFS